MVTRDRVRDRAPGDPRLPVCAARERSRIGEHRSVVTLEYARLLFEIHSGCNTEPVETGLPGGAVAIAHAVDAARAKAEYAELTVAAVAVDHANLGHSTGTVDTEFPVATLVILHALRLANTDPRLAGLSQSTLRVDEAFSDKDAVASDADRVFVAIAVDRAFWWVGQADAVLADRVRAAVEIIDALRRHRQADAIIADLIWAAVEIIEALRRFEHAHAFDA